MSDFFAALGLVLVTEGVIYGGFPAVAKRLAMEMQELPENTLRYGGLAAVALGVAVVWLVRG